MPYPPQPYPPVTRSASVGCTGHQTHSPSTGPVEPENTVSEQMALNGADSPPRGAGIATGLAGDDTSTQVWCPVVAPDLPDSTIETSERYLVSPGTDEDAYILHSASLGVVSTPATVAENGLVSAVSALESPTNTWHDGADMDGKPEPKLVYGLDTANPTVPEPPSRLLRSGVFLDDSHSRCLSSPPAPNDSRSEVHRTTLLGQTDLAVPCADGSSNKPQNGLLFKESLSAAFVRPASPLPPSSPGSINGFVEYLDSTLFSPISSPARTSSPPNFFTSSPSRHAALKSPPTSPGPIKMLTAVPSTICSKPLKRPRSTETVITSADDLDEGSEEQTVKKKKPNTYDPPQPKRSTHLSQRREYAKLKMPFRSPVTAATKDCPRYKDTSPSSEPDPPSSPTPLYRDSAIVKTDPSYKLGKDFMAQVRTPRASAQFKSPLTTVAASGSRNGRRPVNASPNVQALQLRLQTLKRALKIRDDREGEKLEGLAQKWTDVAREVAWEVWSVVKDNVQDVTKLGSGRGALQCNWGWADEGNESGTTGADRPSGDVEMVSDEDEPPVPEDTMSVMLRKMGIDPSTLGWNEAEGEFMEADVSP